MISVLDLDPFTRGWMDADEAIRRGCSPDYSQGDSLWDQGWNARIFGDENEAPTQVLV